MSALTVSGLNLHHGLLHAVRDLSLSVGRGEVVALVGANGAGKTTLLRAIAGAQRVTSGTISFDGADITHVPSHRRVGMGVALVPEGRRLFARMTVEENLAIGAMSGRPGPWSVDKVLETFPNLRDRRGARAGTLSGGEQQATAIGRALMSNPAVLLLDEVSLGLSPIAVDRVYESLGGLMRSGTTILLVEQDLTRAMKVASRVICMLEGRVVLEGETASLPRERITEAYFGLGQEIGGAGMINTIVQGVLLGGYYALIAAGLTFMFSVMRIINLAHGSLAVLAAYLLFALAKMLGVSPFLGLFLVMPAMAGLGFLLQRLVLDRSLRAGPLVPILATFGLAIVIDNTLFEIFGANTTSLAPFIGSLSYDAFALPGNLYVGALPAYIFITAVVVLGGLQLMLSFTPIGRAIRATAEDPETAGLAGINARMVTAIATAIALVTVAIAGLALGLRGTFDAYSGGAQLLFAFEAAVIGGAGRVWGTLVGGMVLALAQSFGAQLSPLGFLIGGHAVFLIVLFARILLAGGVAGLIRRRA